MIQVFCLRIQSRARRQHLGHPPAVDRRLNDDGLDPAVRLAGCLVVPSGSR
jgi:hypothetical protein